MVNDKPRTRSLQQDRAVVNDRALRVHLKQRPRDPRQESHPGDSTKQREDCDQNQCGELGEAGLI